MPRQLAALVIAVAVMALAVPAAFAQDAATAQVKRQTVQERVEKIRKETQQRQAKVRADVCPRRKAQLQAAPSRLSNSIMALKSAFDRLYVRVQGFYDSGQLTVSNYDELKAAVDVAKAEAEAAIAAVDSFEVTVNCDQAGLGEQLDGFRSAVKEAKAALKEYRLALVNLIKALRAAAAEENSDE